MSGDKSSQCSVNKCKTDTPNIDECQLEYNKANTGMGSFVLLASVSKKANRHL